MYTHITVSIIFSFLLFFLLLHYFYFFEGGAIPIPPLPLLICKKDAFSTWPKIQTIFKTKHLIDLALIPSIHHNFLYELRVHSVISNDISAKSKEFITEYTTFGTFSRKYIVSRLAKSLQACLDFFY